VNLPFEKRREYRSPDEAKFMVPRTAISIVYCPLVNANPIRYDLPAFVVF
jgi:hypothetical protein